MLTMARIPVPQLCRYLLGGQLVHRGCLRLRSSRLPAASTTRQAYTTLSNATSSDPIASPVPLIKQLRQQAKAQKASGKKNNSELQTVPGWELTVGIEIHAQLNTRHKLFSPATSPPLNGNPNTHAALFDLALPGSQPMFQPEALIPAIRAALALHCDIQRVSTWDRKHYFWWDQPNGYQITQFYKPFAREGALFLHKRDGIADEDGDGVRIGIRQVQMEQDTAKVLAEPKGVQLVDFNRLGVPLIEIITEPQIHHPRTAAAFVRKVQAYLNSVDACVSGMEAGGLRADVNVSVRRVDEPGATSKPLGQRTEIKNLSSLKAVEDAIIAERDRQIAVLESGGTVFGETRGWTIGGTETRRLRGKEGEVDYRYMPDPDLPPLVISKDVLSLLQDDIARLPDWELDFLQNNCELRERDAMALMQSDKLEYFYQVLIHLKQFCGVDAVVRNCGPLTCNTILHELGRLTSERNLSADGSVKTLDITPAGESSRVPASHLAQIIFHQHKGNITKEVAKELLFSVFRGDIGDGSPSGYRNVTDAIEAEDLWFRQLSKDEHAELAATVLADEDETLEKKFKPHFSEGKTYPEGQLMRLIGKMRRAGPVGQVHPQMAAHVLREAIEARFAD